VDVTPPEPTMQMAVQVWNSNKDEILGWQQAQNPGETTDFIVDTHDAGPYYLEIAQASDSARSPKPYMMMATVTPAADVNMNNDSFMKAEPITLGQAVSGSILPRGEHDWYQVEIPEQGELAVTLSQNPPELTMVAQVLNADKQVVAGWQGAPAAGGDAAAVAQIKEPGTYYVELASASDGARSTGAYHMTVAFKGK